MNESKTADFSELQKIASSTFGAMLLNPALTAMLQLQSNALGAIETAVTEWFRRRREALADIECVVTRMRGCEDPAEVWGLQQEWMRHALRRVSDDAAQWQKVAMALAAAGSVAREDEGKRTPSTREQSVVGPASGGWPSQELNMAALSSRGTPAPRLGQNPVRLKIGGAS